MNLRRAFARTAFLLLVGVNHGFGQTITGIQPQVGSVGDTPISIFGSGFAPGGMKPASISVVFQNASPITDPNVVLADNQINVTVPSGARTGTVTVSINGGSAASSPQPFIVIPLHQPYVTNFTPVSGASSTMVTLTGVHFDSSFGNVTNISFNGKLGSGFNNATIGQIQIQAPAGVTSGPLIALSANGHQFDFNTATNTVSDSTNFYVQPSISSFSPTNGRAGTDVTITGVNFTGATDVQFKGLSANGFTIVNNTNIVATAPNSVVTGPIKVITPFFNTTTTTNFHVLPTISTFAPAFGAAGTPVVITGLNLNEGSSPGHATVSFNGVAATTYGSFSANTVTASVPVTAMSGPITVTTTNGSMTSSVLFYVSAQITAFTPNNGAPGTTVQITGTSFTNASAVSFNGTPAASFNVTNNTTIGAVVPAGVTTGPISVTTPAGTTNSGNLLFYGVPMITGFVPSQGLPGTNVTINGVNLLGATSVLFSNNVSASPFFATNNGFILTSVPGLAQTGPITVITPGGSFTTSTNFILTYTNDLAVTVVVSPDPVFVGSNLFYSIFITNSGPFDSPHTMLTNWLPPSVVVKTNDVRLNVSGNLVWADLGDVTAPIIFELGFEVVPQTAGPITNFATISGDYFDSNPANNSNTVISTVWPLPVLKIQNVPTNQVMVSWPAPLSGFTLQFRTALGTNVLWTNDMTARTISGTNVFVTETNFVSPKFFRLTN